MSLLEQEESYYKYLTERMDRGESNNIVIPTVVELIKLHCEKSPQINVLDIGCYNGAMLNRIRSLTPENLRLNVNYIGGEIDGNIIEKGRNRYPHLTFVQMDLHGTLNHLGKNDIVIVSNVLHEVIPNNSSEQDTEHAVENAVNKISGVTKKNGSLVILDGLKPDNDDTQITVEFTKEKLSLFNSFKPQYEAFQVQGESINNNQLVLRIKDLAAFLTKARYLSEAYWPIESKQLYQYFTRRQFYRILGSSGFEVESFEPQTFTDDQIRSTFISVEPNAEYPAKNVLIVAKKIN